MTALQIIKVVFTIKHFLIFLVGTLNNESHNIRRLAGVENYA